MRTQSTRAIYWLTGVLALGLAGVASAQGIPEPGIVLYGKVWDHGGLVHAGELRWTYAAPGTTVTITVPLEAIATPGGDAFSYRLLIPAESAVAGMALSPNTLPATDTPVRYTRSAAIDGVPVILAPGVGTDTFSLAERGKVRRLDLVKDGSVTPTYAISGNVGYAGRQPGGIMVQAYDNPGFTGVPAGAAVLPVAGRGPFVIGDLPAGTYYVRAFKDQDGNGQPGATEAWGASAANPLILPPDAVAADITLIDIDVDGDGLPDWWENLRPGGMAAGFDDDDDGDGAWNGIEYAAGTDPDDRDAAPGPVAWWRLDEGGGDTASDTSGNHHDGALVNGPAWTDGIHRGALSFDGVDDRVVVPASPDLDLTRALTLQAWVRRDGPGPDAGRIICKRDDDGGTGYALALSGDGTVEFHLGGAPALASLGAVPSRRWVHVAATFDGSVARASLYIDGRLDAASAHADPCPPNALDLRLGGGASGGLQAAVGIDEPKVFGYARSPAAIAADAFAVTAFAINGGAAATSSRTVTLDSLCAGYPVDCIASEDAGFAGAAWAPYDGAAPFTLSPGDGAKTVFLQVRTADAVWGPLSDTIVLDTVPPAILHVDSTAADGIHGVGSTIDILVAFSEPIVVTGTPLLSLETGAEDALASYSDGSGTSTLTFRYTVAAGHLSLDLDCTATDALLLNGGTLRDAAGNDANLTLPPPGAPHSLGANRDIAVGHLHTVLFDLGAPGTRTGGGELQQIIPHGAAAVAPEFTVTTGWRFTGWSGPFDSVDADVVIMALFAAKQVPVLNWPPPEPMMHGTALSAAQLNASANTPGTFVYAPPEGTVLRTGTYTLHATFTPDDEENWTTAAATAELTVGPAPLTCTADHKTRSAGVPNPPLTITYTGLRDGDTAPATAPTATCGADPASPPGTYPIILTGGADPNYTLTLVNGTLTVTAPTEVPPAGDFSVVFPGAANPAGRRIWDFAGMQQVQLGSYTLQMNLQHDPKGSLSGPGRLFGTMPSGTLVDGPLTAKGKAAGKSGTVTAAISLAGKTATSAVKLKLTLALDGANLTGVGSGSVTAKPGGKDTIATACAMPLDPAMTGSFGLDITLVQDAKGAITGFGVLILANGRALPVLIKGKKAAGVVALQVVGDKAADPLAGAVKLKLTVRTLNNGTAEVVTLSGKAFGQTLAWP